MADIKRTCEPTAAGASDRVSAFSEKTSVKFVMVRGKEPPATQSKREGCENENEEDKGRIKRAVLGEGGGNKGKRRDSGAMDDMGRPRDGFTTRAMWSGSPNTSRSSKQQMSFCSFCSSGLSNTAHHRWLLKTWPIRLQH